MPVSTGRTVLLVSSATPRFPNLVRQLPMAANGSSANMANIITALGNAFKDPSGATMSNDRLAAVLLQNMNQLTDLAKQGKLNQQQIMQVRHTL
jgi:hypothetical protein